VEGKLILPDEKRLNDRKKFLVEAKKE